MRFIKFIICLGMGVLTPLLGLSDVSYTLWLISAIYFMGDK